MPAPPEGSEPAMVRATACIDRGYDYRTAIVTPAWLAAVPTSNITGTSPVAFRVFGTRALMRNKPTNPGASPANVISAGSPPMVTPMGSVGWGGADLAAWPSTPAGCVAPSPVVYRLITDPRGAASAIEFNVPS